MYDDYWVESSNLRLVKVEATYTTYVIAYRNEEITEVDDSTFLEEVRLNTTEVNAREAPSNDYLVMYSPQVLQDLKQISERAAKHSLPEYSDDVKSDILNELRIDAYAKYSTQFNEELFKPGADMTYPTLRRGDTGKKVQELQSALNLAVRMNPYDIPHTKKLAPISTDGNFGPKTEEAVMAFQRDRKLYADGVAGPVTWGAIDDVCMGRLHMRVSPDKPVSMWSTVSWVTDYKQGYNRFSLRSDIAEVFEERVLKPMQEATALMTSSGSRRSLTVKVGPNQSATSFHYLGTAFDLFVYSGMVDPHTDPFVITVDSTNPRFWIVWARTQDTTKGRLMTLDGVTYDKSGKADYPQKVVQTTGHFINFTELVAEAGFKPIPWRPAFMDPKKKTNGAAEWWHFQYEADLVRGVTTYGSQLLRVYSQKDLLNTPPWKFRDLKFGTQWR